MNKIHEMLSSGGLVVERDDQLLTFLLQTPGLFFVNGYRALQRREGGGFVPCTRLMHTNGKEKLVYRIDGLKPLAALMPTMGADAFAACLRNMLEVASSLGGMDAVQCGNILPYLDMIFVNEKVGTVYLLYLPLAITHPDTQQQDFEKNLKANILAGWNACPQLQTEKLADIYTAFSDVNCPLAVIRGRFGDDSPTEPTASLPTQQPLQAAVPPPMSAPPAVPAPQPEKKSLPKPAVSLAMADLFPTGMRTVPPVQEPPPQENAYASAQPQEASPIPDVYQTASQRFISVNPASLDSDSFSGGAAPPPPNGALDSPISDDLAARMAAAMMGVQVPMPPQLPATAQAGPSPVNHNTQQMPVAYIPPAPQQQGVNLPPEQYASVGSGAVPPAARPSVGTGAYDDWQQLPAEPEKKQKKPGLFASLFKKDTAGAFPDEEDLNRPTEILAEIFMPGIMLVGDRTPQKTELVISGPEFFIGKKENSVDGVITFNNAISRVHCKIVFEGGSYFLVDLGSANGTYLNGRRLSVNTKAPLQIGDKVRLANSNFVIKSV